MPTNECPECGAETESWTETVEVGQPLNWNSRGAVAPRYRTKEIRITACTECEWYGDLR